MLSTPKFQPQSDKCIYYLLEGRTPEKVVRGIYLVDFNAENLLFRGQQRGHEFAYPSFTSGYRQQLKNLKPSFGVLR